MQMAARYVVPFKNQANLIRISIFWTPSLPKRVSQSFRHLVRERGSKNVRHARVIYSPTRLQRPNHARVHEPA
jgi:hypothetical protein